MSKPVIVFPELYRAQLQAMLPDSVEVRGFTGIEECLALAPQADIGWFDDFAIGAHIKGPLAATNAKWINTVLVGLDAFPLKEIEARGQIFTSGAGMMPDVVADYAVMGALTLAKRLDEVVRAHDRKEWIRPPVRFEMLGSKALVIGYGAIGSEIGKRLKAFGVEVTGVRRNTDNNPDIIGPDAWRARLAEFDFIILAAPSTSDTKALLGAEELAAMKPGARIINIARGDLIDQPALIASLRSGHTGAAFLDVTTPEPLPDRPALGRAEYADHHAPLRPEPDQRLAAGGGKVPQESAAFPGG